MLQRLWDSVKSLAAQQATAADITLPLCDVAITDDDRIIDLLRRLEDDGGELHLQIAGKSELRSCRVFAVTRTQLTLRGDLDEGLASPLAVNVTGSGRTGALMFSGQLHRTRLGGLWRCKLPAEVLCVQSRQHRRVLLADRSDMVTRLLLASPTPHAHRILDLSEQGMGLFTKDAALDGHRLSEGGTLELDGVRLLLPTIKVVHTRAVLGGNRLGLQFTVHGASDERHLRRFLNTAETHSRLL